jgi:hypothetical protein
MVIESNPSTRSREAAEECSPRRKPWVSVAEKTKAPEGRKRLVAHIRKYFVAYHFLDE